MNIVKYGWWINLIIAALATANERYDIGVIAALLFVGFNISAVGFVIGEKRS